MTIALHVHNVQTIHKSKNKNYETRNTTHMLGFMSIGVVVTKIMTFFQKCVQIGPDFTSGRSVQAVGLHQPTGWLAGCSSALARYSDVAGVSQSDWPLCVY